ncbi:MAG TPA: TIGR04053 family radical SAM/SPASM domain-containing protein [Acidimicrobiales bacterium]|nr:TIGR04053 family radical SAM/SPASM domain-containing protein [Acidimicrobiales bacterium]
MNFDEAPILVFWETTRACELACRHCRAEAMPEPAPDELTTSEGCRLIEQLAGFGPRPPVLILTGGDVMRRSDLVELVGAARRVGLPVALAPSVTSRLNTGPLVELRHLGVSSVSLSLDGASAATHEAVRGVHGHFGETVAALNQLRSLGFRTQVNTAVMRANVDELAGIAAVVRDVGAASWEVFFLVKVGRGRDEQELSARENEDVAHLLFEASHYGFAVRTVEGPWCRRVAAWRKGTPLTTSLALRPALGPLYRRQSRLLLELLGPPLGPPQMASAGTRDGKGIFFVSHNGWVYPAGFLPVRLGNVKDEDPVNIYRHHPLLRAIRAAEFGGRCGRCEFRDDCGGSRARAFASSGDVLAEDPACAYIPA